MLRSDRPTATLLTALAAVLIALPAAGQTIVSTGDDLAAICDAAADGAVIEIHSDAVFVGTLDWVGKSLTVRAGAGYAPTVRGDDGAHAALLQPGSPTTGATFEGLRLERGDITPAFPFESPAVVFQAWGGASLSTSVTLTDCAVFGQVNTGGTGDSTATASFTNTTFEGPVNLFGYFTAPLVVDFEGCTFEVQVGALNGSFGGSPRSMEFTARRCVFKREFGLNAYDGGSLTATLVSCLIDGSGGFTPFGVRVYNDALVTSTNLTVTGCSTGIRGAAGATWHNLLLYGNGADLADVAPGEISNSLIEDGTYDGTNGNFTGTVLVDADYALLECADGTDAGDNAAPNLGALDVWGAPRIADDDGDLVATVDVGAVEGVGSLPGSIVVSNGSGANPTGYVATTPAVAGGTFTALILPLPTGSTVATVIAIDAPSSPLTSSAWVGEVLVNLGGSTFYDASLAIHSLPVPATCAVVGLTVHTQGFRVDSVGGVVTIHCLNRNDLTIGG